MFSLSPIHIFKFNINHGCGENLKLSKLWIYVNTFSLIVTILQLKELQENKDKILGSLKKVNFNDKRYK